MQDQTWLITGANGSVGRCLAAGLRGDVDRLILSDLRTEPSPYGDIRHLDILDREALNQAFRDVDGVIHLAAVSDEADFYDLVDANIIGTRNVLEAARRQGVRRVVYASSNRLTGFWPSDQTIGVDAAVRPDGFYGVSKVACEALGRLYVDKFDLEFVAVRIGTYLEKPQNARHLATWLSPRDCVAAFRAAMVAPIEGYAAFYAVSANTRRWWDLTAGHALGFDPVDDAETFADEFPDKTIPFGLQGGSFTTPEFSLSRQREA
jgi:uronate dehydrogenase